MTEMPNVEKVQLWARWKCQECDGMGTVMHPDWVIFWRTHEQLGTNEEIEAWFAKNTDHDYPPDEETCCPECGGDRYMAGWVELNPILVNGGGK